MTDLYIERYAYPKTFIESPPSKNLKLAVVIPCYNETDLINTLVSVKDCELPPIDIEVLVIINQPEKESQEITKNNLQTFKQAIEWSNENSSEQLNFHIVFADNLPSNKSGVGLARKIGMDEAVKRFSGNHDEILVSLDADCLVMSNYLLALYNHFKNEPLINGCSIYFEHHLPEKNEKAKSIIIYELHLRYYINALRWSGFPLAYHTIGSCFAVRSEIYKMQGGMNSRQAGEDFYFLQKIIQLTGYSDLTNTTVFPSSRVSNRTPFGTGSAISKLDLDSSIDSYSPEVFEDLKMLFDITDLLFASTMDEVDYLILSLSSPLKKYLVKINFRNTVQNLKKENSTVLIYRKAFYRWFNGLKVLQYVHFRDDKSTPMHNCLEWLNSKISFYKNPDLDLIEVLKALRSYDKRSN